MTTERQAVKALADNLVKTFRSMMDDNNKVYVDNQIKNYGGNGGTASRFTGHISYSQVDGLYDYIADSLSDAIEDDDPSVSRIITSIGGIASLEVESFVADTANIDKLYANYGEFMNIVAGSIEAQEAKFRQLATDIAYVTSGFFGTASIDSAMIGVSTTQTAFIREGIGGKYYIDKLAVEEANIVNLSVGNLMIGDANGNLVRIMVDEHGEVVIDPDSQHVVTGVVTFDGDNIISSGALVTKGNTAPQSPAEGDIWCDTNQTPNVVKVWNGTSWTIDATINPDDLADGEYYGTMDGSKIRNASINATELNVESIFAKNAKVMDLVAANINATQLFANEGVIPQLKTSIISSLNDSNFNNALGTGISQIVVANNLLDLMVESVSGASELTLTDEMIEAVGNKFSVIADEIDLSGNDSVQITSTNQISATVRNNMDISGNSSVRLLSDLIGLVVENEDASSAIVLTPGMVGAISDEVDVKADTIDLTANTSVKTVVGNELDDQLESLGPEIVQIVTDSTEYQELQTRVSQTEAQYTVVVDRVDEAEDQLDVMSTWFTFTEDGFSTGKSGSTYSTLTDDVGFHVLQSGEKIGSFAKRQLQVEEIKIGSISSTKTHCVIREAADGGLIITTEAMV